MNVSFMKLSWKWTPDQYLPPFDAAKTAPESARVSCYTRTSNVSTVNPVAKANGQFLRALQRVYMAENPAAEAAFGYARLTNGYILIELHHLNGEGLRRNARGGTGLVDEDTYTQVAYSPKNGAFYSREVTPSGQSVKEFGLEKGGSPTAFCMALVLAAMDDPAGEFGPAWKRFSYLTGKALGPQGLEDAERAECCDTACLLCDQLYRRVFHADHCTDPIHARTGNGQVRELTANAAGSFSAYARDVRGLVTGIEIIVTPEDVNPAAAGKGFPGTAPAVTAGPRTVKELEGFYAFNPLRKYTPYEEGLRASVPVTYQVTEEARMFCGFIKESCSLPNPVRNFLFIGNAGTGKSECAKLMAFGTGLPMVQQSLHSDSDSTEFTTLVAPDGRGGWLWNDGPIIRAAKYGWLCEVSEADTLLKPGDLSYLNPLFDSTRRLELATGEAVTVHPDAVFVFTVNASYEGCRAMNQAFKDRLLCWHFNEPADEGIISRVMGESGLNDRETVRKMADVLHRVEDHCRDAYVNDGVTGIRSLIDWARLVRLGMDPWTAARKSVIWKWTFDEEEHGALMRCVETQFVCGEVEP